MQLRVTTIGIVVAAAILLVTGLTLDFGEVVPAGKINTVMLLVGCLLMVIGWGLCWARSGWAARHQGLLLNWFLPSLRSPRAGEAKPANAGTRFLRRILPDTLFSDHTTKRRGLARRVLRRMGISWLASPVRRLVQATCLLVFLLLFFWVCWPYTARPEPAGRVSEGWQLVELDGGDGTLRFQADVVPPWIRQEQVVFLIDEDASNPDEERALPVTVQQMDGPHVALHPRAELTESQLDRLLTMTGDWSIHEHNPEAWPTHYADQLIQKQFLPADIFLIADPLVSLSTAVASRSWIWSLACAGVVLGVCILVPRGFCGYLCPLGTLIDLFDWSIGSRIRRFRVPENGWWVHIKYYLLLGTMICAVFGVMVAGYVAAIPVVTRGLLFCFEPLQNGAARGWHLVPPLHSGHLLSTALFLGVFGLGFLRPRFWCKYVCPSGATFSLGNLFRFSERKVEASCIHCNKCVEVCPFDAIKSDFTTRVTDCTLCQTCGGVCPTHAIKFVERWNRVELKVEGDPPTGESSLGRRGFLSLAAGAAAAAVGGVGVVLATDGFGANLDDPGAFRPVRPPGSVPEHEFLQMCIRCGECFKVCPNNVLQAESFQQGLEGLWTPHVVADWAGCESSCNACGQVCPTGAIRALSMEEKKAARMGLAIVNEQTCLPFADRESCQICVDECTAAGYQAIEFKMVHSRFDEQGTPLRGSGYLAPVVLAEKCVGCGLCQTRCYGINVKTKQLLTKSAIIIEAGPGKEDRLISGSYVDLRAAEAKLRAQKQRAATGGSEFFVPQP